MLPCPVEGCRQRCRSPDTLFTHLFKDHEKTEIISALVARVAKEQGA